MTKSDNPAGLLMLFLLIATVPCAIIAIAGFSMFALGVDSHRALSLAGLIGVSLAAPWGAIVAWLRLDKRE